MAANIGELWDAGAYWDQGHIPWTIFAYPLSLADSQRLPRDLESRQFLAELQSRGLRVGVWSHPENPGTVYFACPLDERERIAAAIEDLERQGAIPPGFPAQRTEHLFSASQQA